MILIHRTQLRYGKVMVRVIVPADVAVTDTGAIVGLDNLVTRTDPNELRFKPAGDDNDFMIEEPNARSSNVYNVDIHWGRPGRYAGAVFTQDSDEESTLTVTVAASQTAAELITVINAAVTVATGPRVRAVKLLTDGTGPEVPEDERSPLGGLPANNRGFGAGSCSYCH